MELYEIDVKKIDVYIKFHGESPKEIYETLLEWKKRFEDDLNSTRYRLNYIKEKYPDVDSA